MTKIVRAIYAALTLSEPNYLPKLFHVSNHFQELNMICEFFQVCFWWKCLTSGAKSWNTWKNCFWIITENPYKILWGCRTCG